MSKTSLITINQFIQTSFHVQSTKSSQKQANYNNENFDKVDDDITRLIKLVFTFTSNVSCS